MARLGTNTTSTRFKRRATFRFPSQGNEEARIAEAKELKRQRKRDHAVSELASQVPLLDASGLSNRLRTRCGF
jgi:hypothetical protein